jgi:hypothetical protein
MESNNFPLPLSGEGWGEGGFGIISPSPLSSPLVERRLEGVHFKSLANTPIVSSVTIGDPITPEIEGLLCLMFFY